MRAHNQKPAIAATAFLMLTAAGCSTVTVKQQPFAPLAIQVKRSASPPPRVVLTASSIQITEKIQFALDSAEILPVSDGLIDEIASVLKDNEQIQEVQIEGHTDSTGGRDYNQKLSQRRSESVQAALVSRGIEAKRLTTKGFGPDRAIADNANEEGREKNRRVEFNILKQSEKKTLVQD